MYDMLSRADLAQHLNQSPTPMYALERTKNAAPFRFIVLNTAMERAALCRQSDVIGKTLSEVLPADESIAAQCRVSHCMDTLVVTQFTDRFTITAQPFAWDTTLHPIRLVDGRQRIVASAIRKDNPTAAQPETVALEDIKYFSSIADFQIQNLISLFETYDANDLLRAETEQRIAKLSGMCRSVQVTVSEIGKSIRAAQAVHQKNFVRPNADHSPLIQTTLTKCGTLQALTDLATKS